MGDLFDALFVPPPMPRLGIPLPERMQRPILNVLGGIYQVVFKAGWYQGFLAGCILTTVVILGLTIRMGGRRDAA